MQQEARDALQAISTLADYKASVESGRVGPAIHGQSSERM